VVDTSSVSARKTLQQWQSTYYPTYRVNNSALSANVVPCADVQQQEHAAVYVRVLFYCAGNDCRLPSEAWRQSRNACDR